MTPPDLKARTALLRQYGNFALAFSAVHQPGLCYFGDERGFLAYVMIGGSALVLTNPLAPHHTWDDLIEGLVSEKGDVSFWQVSRDVADRLAAHGFRVNEMGTESRLDLDTYTFTGPKKRNFRTAANRMTAQGLKTIEAHADEIDIEQLNTVSEQWRRTRTVKKHELTFLIRPVVLADEKDVRKFFTLGPDGGPVAFASFDPVYEAGNLTGYLMASKRRLPSSDPLVGYDLVRCAVETFRGEGLKWLLLGLAPGDKVKDKAFKSDWTTSQCLHFLRENPVFHRFIYPIRGLIKHKASFLGETERSYCATNRWPGFWRFYRMGRACKII